MIWAGVPQTLELGIIDMLLSHLRSDKAPARQEIPRVWQPDAVSAQFSLVALGGVESFLDDARYHSQMFLLGTFKFESQPGIGEIIRGQFEYISLSVSDVNSVGKSDRKLPN
jgi:hypothetical protein